MIIMIVISYNPVIAYNDITMSLYTIEHSSSRQHLKQINTSINGLFILFLVVLLSTPLHLMFLIRVQCSLMFLIRGWCALILLFGVDVPLNSNILKAMDRNT